MTWSHRYAVETDYERRKRIYLQNYVYKGLKDTPEAKAHYRTEVAPYKPADPIPPRADSHLDDAVQCSSCGHIDSKEFMSENDGNYQCRDGIGCSK